MDRMISYLVTMLVAAALGWGACQFHDTHPPFHYRLPWYLGHKALGLPDSLLTQRDDARAQLAAAQRAADDARAAMQAQSAQIQALSVLGAQAKAQAAAAVAQANARAAKAAQRAALANSYHTAPQADVCQDLLAADAVARQALQ